MAAASSPRIVHVAVAVIRDGDGRVLVAQRLPHQHLAGLWEFPGGKLEPGETLAEGMAREIREELGIGIGAIAPLMRIAHEYPEKTVLLDVWRVRGWTGEPHGVEGQPLRWLHPRDMRTDEFPPADIAIIEALRLPFRYVISPDAACEADVGAFVAACKRVDARLVQVRLRARPALAAPLVSALRAALPEVRLLLNSDTRDALLAAGGALPAVDGLHLTAAALHAQAASSQRPAGHNAGQAGFVAASCHDERQLADARAIGAAFVTVSPVLPTASHPGATTLGWTRFAELATAAGIPVYALGGLSMRDLDIAEASGAVGVAGISGVLGG